MKYFFPKTTTLPVVEQTHFWIVEITRVEHPTCLLMNQIPFKLVFIFVFLSLFVQVKLVSGRRSLVGDVRGQAVAPEHLNLQDRTLWRTTHRGKTLITRGVFQSEDSQTRGREFVLSPLSSLLSPLSSLLSPLFSLLFSSLFSLFVSQH